MHQALENLNGVSKIETVRSDGYPTFRITSSSDVDLCPTIFDLARQENWPMRELRRDVKTLESVFNQLATVE